MADLGDGAPCSCKRGRRLGHLEYEITSVDRIDGGYVSGSEATSSDDLLIRRAQLGEPGAFDDLIRQNYRLIHRWALVKTGDADDAEDVTQRVLIQIFKKLGTFRGRSSFDSWLYRITSNAAGELHRRRGARERAVAKWEEKQGKESAEPVVLGRIAGSEAAEVARAFFSELPERQREVFDLVELQGYTAAEVAEMLVMRASTVRVHLLRARRTLRARILEQHPALAEDFS